MRSSPSLATASPDRPGVGARLRRDQGGFSLIEILVCALMVVLIGAATAKALITTSHFSGDQRLRSQADELATQDQERLRGVSDEQLNQLEHQSTSRTQAVSATSFTVRSAASYVSTSGVSGCTTTAATTYKITSTVSWTEKFSSRPSTVTEESLVSRPVAGDLLVSVNDQTGQPMPGVTIKATGTSSGTSMQTATTDVNGCVLFAGLGPGSYTVLATPTGSGYVDQNASAAPISATTTVNAASPATVNLQMGQAGSIVATLATRLAGANAEADGISWIGSGASSGGMTSPATIPSSASMVTGGTTGSLYPFDMSSVLPASYAGNYSVWGGRCAQQKPPGQDIFSVAPGSVGQAQTVYEPVLYVGNITYKPTFGTASTQKPADVKLRYACGGSTDSYLVPVAAGSASSVPQYGWLTYPGQPYAASGALTVCADYTTGGQYYYGQVTTAVNTSFTASNTVPTITVNQSASGRCP